MTKYIFVGDVHGHTKAFSSLVRELRIEHGQSVPIIQVGDMGIGFKGVKYKRPDNSVFFIHGNHDNPKHCATTPGYLGRHGTINRIGGDALWYCSGAWSIDQKHRIPNKTWWADEQLSYQEMNKALSEFNGQKIVFTHDCPLAIYYKLGISRAVKTLTACAFNLITEHETPPKLWVFGHHHRKADFWHKGTRYVCLPELETIVVEVD
jgi:predicted phosphodiesterase